jgi:sugar phosphate permease
VVNRWFVSHRGLMMGLLSASAATGSLVFLPGMAALAQSGGWQPVAIVITLATGVLAPIAFLLLPERPSDIGLTRFGAGPDDQPPRSASARVALTGAFTALARASRVPTFWLLFGSFFICGLTTNGLVGVHMISLCMDRGLPEVRAAGLLALMGLFDLIGTTASGWLTDRYDPRKLLFIYYAFRGLSLIALPFLSFDMISLTVFAVFYGLDWIATVPPTAKLATETFGDEDGPIVFGWIAAGHQIGAASAAFGAGAWRASQGRYLEAFVVAGAAALTAAVASLLVKRMQARPLRA